jgi:hypothetical protein
VNEERWLTGKGIATMKRALGKLSARKQRLFGCACCRRVWHLMAVEGHAAVEAAERLADGLVTEPDWKPVWWAAHRCGCRRNIPCFRKTATLAASYLFGKARSAAHYSSNMARSAVWDATRDEAAHRAEGAAQCDLLRDVAGNPYRPVPFDPAWRTPGAVALAGSLYEGRCFEAMPMLGDALEEAGCTDAVILAHCRGPGPHVRGCWVVDGLLGKS